MIPYNDKKMNSIEIKINIDLIENKFDLNEFKILFNKFIEDNKWEYNGKLIPTDWVD